MTEDEPLPLARMVTIKDPAFWIFLGVCIILYSYNKFFGIDKHAGDMIYSSYGDGVCMAAFIGLFLTIAAGLGKKPQAIRILNVCCYVFELASVIVLGVLIFIK